MGGRGEGWVGVGMGVGVVTMSLVCSSALLSLTRLLSSTIIGWRGLISNLGRARVRVRGKVRVRARARARARARVRARVRVRIVVRVRVRVVVGGLVSNMRLLFMNSNLLWSAKAWLFITW